MMHWHYSNTRLIRTLVKSFKTIDMTLLEKLLGKEYYLNVLNDRQQDYVASTPFETYREAMAHKRSLEENRTVHYVRTISFRSKEPFHKLDNLSSLKPSRFRIEP